LPAGHARISLAIGEEGAESAVTPHWIIGADYIHYDLDRTTVTSVNLPVTTPATTISASPVVAGNILRAVVNYKF